MKILLLGNNKIESKIYSILKLNHRVDRFTDKLLQKDISTYDLVISYGYNYLIKRKHLIQCKRPPINLHISLLPLNRGSDPNFWSWYNNTKHGVTIHHIDEGIDTGDIILQKEIFFNKKTKLTESYNILNENIQNIFLDNLDEILNFNYKVKKQFEKGNVNFHKNLPYFDNQWDNTIDNIKLIIKKNEK
tara:strand:+ start:9905 stop:10471 length:567 start_codon:yes stop_codon:yes gene_type:complete